MQSSENTGQRRQYSLATLLPFLKVQGLDQNLAFEKRKVREVLSIDDMHGAIDHGRGITMLYNSRPIPVVDCRKESRRKGLLNATAIIAEVVTCNVAIIVDNVNGTVEIPLATLSIDKWDDTHNCGLSGVVFNELENLFLIDLDLMLGSAVKTFLLHHR